MQYTDIRFPHLGIVLSHVGRYISLGNFQIMFYGIIIACGFLVGLWVAQQEAKRTGQNPEIYMDYLLVDDSGDYWCKNLLCCIFMGFL